MFLFTSYPPFRYSSSCFRTSTGSLSAFPPVVHSGPFVRAVSLSSRSLLPSPPHFLFQHTLPLPSSASFSFYSFASFLFSILFLSSPILLNFTLPVQSFIRTISTLSASLSVLFFRHPIISHDLMSDPPLHKLYIVPLHRLYKTLLSLHPLHCISQVYFYQLPKSKEYLNTPTSLFVSLNFYISYCTLIPQSFYNYNVFLCLLFFFPTLF